MHPLIFLHNFKRLRRLYRSFNLAATDLVLDVGSGQNPNPRSNVLCDRFVNDDTERNLGALVVDRPFVMGDAARLPFKDKSFDFVICSHLLEHVADVGVVISELQRVGKRGYIETPSRIWEKLHSFPFHRWLVSNENNALVFEAKARQIHDAELKSWVQNDLGKSKLGGLFETYLYDLGTLTRLYWQGEIRYRVEGVESSGVDFSQSHATGTHESVLPGCAKPSLGKRVINCWGASTRRKASRRLHNRQDLLALCACPKCRSTLALREETQVYCHSCGLVGEVSVVSGQPWVRLESSGAK